MKEEREKKKITRKLEKYNEFVEKFQPELFNVSPSKRARTELHNGSALPILLEAPRLVQFQFQSLYIKVRIIIINPIIISLPNYLGLDHKYRHYYLQFIGTP